MANSVNNNKKGRQGRKVGAKQADFAQKCHAVTLNHKVMSESRSDGKAGLTKMQCLNKVVRDRHLKKFSAITVWKWLDEASDDGGIFSFVRDEEYRGRPSEFTPDKAKAITDQYKDDRSTPSRIMAAVLGVSHSTASRWSKWAGFVPKRLRQITMLTPGHKAARLGWSVRELAKPEPRFIYRAHTDEKLFKITPRAVIYVREEDCDDVLRNSGCMGLGV